MYDAQLPIHFASGTVPLPVDTHKVTAAAIAQADEHADELWRQLFYDSLVRIAVTRHELVAHDVVEYMQQAHPLVTTHEPRAIGAVMRRAQKNGIILPTDRFTPTTNPIAHRAPKRVWKSLIFKPQN